MGGRTDRDRAVLLLVGSSIAPVVLVTGLTVFGVGLGLTTPNLMSAALGSVPAATAGAAGYSGRARRLRDVHDARTARQPRSPRRQTQVCKRSRRNGGALSLTCERLVLTGIGSTGPGSNRRPISPTSAEHDVSNSPKFALVILRTFTSTATPTATPTAADARCSSRHFHVGPRRLVAQRNTGTSSRRWARHPLHPDRSDSRLGHPGIPRAAARQISRFGANRRRRVGCDLGKGR